ncbi:MAG: hypothetical protein U1D55_02490 [Phycisphaerae bacterium]
MAASSSTSSGEIPSTPLPAPPPPSPVRRKRRWLRWLGAIVGVPVLLIAVLVAALPWIVSQPAVSRRLIATANDMIRGELAADRVSVSWTGPVSIEGLRVRDAQHRDVFSVERVQSVGGLWRILTQGGAFGEVRISKPHVALLFDEANRLSLVDALEPRTPNSPDAVSETQSQESPPHVVGKIVIDEGTLSVERPGQPAYAISDVGVDLDIRTLNEIAGTLHAQTPDGGTVLADVRVNGFTASGKLDPSRANGKIELHTDRPVQIGPLADVLLHDCGLSGSLDLSMNAALSPGLSETTLQANLAGFQRRDASGNTVALDLSAKGEVIVKDDVVAGRVTLSGTPGTANADWSYPLNASLPDLTAERILSAVLGGQSIALPDFSLNVQSELDLVAFEHAAPGLLPLRKDQSLVSGKLEIKSLAIRGGATSSVAGTIALRELAARQGERPIAISPISLDIDAKLAVGGGGLQLARAELNSSFAQIRASGSAADLRAQFQSDLSALRRELGQILDLEKLDLSGEVAGTLTLARADDDRINTKLELNARNAHYASDGRSVDLPQARLAQSGAVRMSGQSVTRIESADFSADLNGAIVARGNCAFDLGSDALQVDADVTRIDLAALDAYARPLGVSGLSGYAGELSGRVSLQRAGTSAPFTSSGQLAGQQLSKAGKAIFSAPAALNWREVAFTPASGALAAKSIDLKSSAADIAVSELRANTSGGSVDAGHIDGAAELREMFKTLGAALDLKEPPKLAGRATLKADVSQSGAVSKLIGQGGVTNLEIGAGEQVVREQQVDLALDAAFDATAKRLTLGSNKLRSKLLTAELRGTVDAIDREAVAALSGRYDASWKELTTLLREFSPTSADLLILNGASSSEFSLNGPLNRPDAKPELRAASAKAGLGWDSAKLVGVDVGSAAINLSLADGQIVIAPTAIAAAQGKVNLAGAIDFRGEAPVVRMPGQTRVLQDVRLTTELSRQLLARINPIFDHVTSIEGSARLDVTDLAFPLGEAARRQSAGGGHLELIDMKVQPTGLLVELLRLGGVVTDRGMLTVVVKGLDFAVDKGRVNYRDFTLIFPTDFDLKFYGSVGLDDTLDLVVSVPVRPELLEALKVRGPVVEYARYLAGTRVDLPLVGTRQQPRLDFAKVDIRPLVERAMQEAAKQSGGKAADDALKKLLGGEKKKQN